MSGRALAAPALPALLAAILVLAQCARELGPSKGEGGLDLRWVWPAGGPSFALTDTARIWVLDGTGRVLVGPAASPVSTSGSVEFTLRVPAGDDRAVRMQFEGLGARGRGVYATGTTGGIDVPNGGAASAEVRLASVVPRLWPIVAEPGALAFDVRWSRVPSAVGYELFVKNAAGETTQALDDTLVHVSLTGPAGFSRRLAVREATPRAKSAGTRSTGTGSSGAPTSAAALDTTFYRVRARLPWGDRTVTSDSAGVPIPALNDLPRVTAVDPPPDATGVPDSSVISLRFNRTIAPWSLGDISVPSEGNSVTLRPEPNGPPVSLGFEWAQEGTELRLLPAGPLRRDTDYLLRVLPLLRDLEGRPLDQEPATPGLQGFESRFATEHDDPLRVIAVTPVDGASGVPLRPLIEARLSRGARPASVNPQTVTLADSAGGPVAVSVALNADSVIRVAASAPLRFGVRYRLTVGSGVRDLRGREGEPLDQEPAAPGLQPFTSSFRTVTQPPGPRVSSVEPRDGEPNAPVGQVVRVRFSRPVQAATLSGNFTVRKLPVGAAIAGSVSGSPDRREFAFTASALERGQRYRVVVAAGGFDGQGNPFGVLDDQGVPFDQDSTLAGFQEFSAFFRVEDNPRVLAVAPSDGRTGVPVDTLVRVRFTHPVARASVVAGGLTLQSGGVVVPIGTYGWSPDTTEVTLRPSAPFAFYRAYSVHADTTILSTRGSKFDQNPDLAGYQSFRSDFRTATDGIAPRVASWFPGDDAPQVPVDTEIRVQFNRAVLPFTVENADNFFLRRLPAGTLVPAARTVDADSAGAVLRPAAPLDYLTEYQVVVTKFVEDPFGQQLDQDPATPFNQDFTGRFRTDQERFAPFVTAVEPAPGATEVPVAALVTVSFSEPMGFEGTLSGAFTLTGPGGAVPGLAVLSPDARRLLFTPSASLRPDVRFDVRVDTTATDQAGNRLDQFPETGLLDPFTSFFFTAPDRTPPAVTSSVPADGDSVVEVTVRPALAFDEPCDPATLLAGVRLLDSLQAVVVPSEVLPAADGRSVELAPLDSLRFDALYVLTATAAVRDTSGNALDQDGGTTGDQPYRAVFRTRRENIPPRVGAVLFDGGLPAPIATKLRVVFTEPCDAATISAATLRLTRLGSAVPALVTQPAPDTALVVPADTLRYDAEYRLVVAGVRDLLGNELDQDPDVPGPQPYELLFRTETDQVPPRVLGVFPAPDSQGVSPDVEVEVRFSEAVDSSTVAAGFALYHTDVGAQLVPGRVTGESDRRRYRYRPDLPLLDAAHYLVRVDGDIRDRAGNVFDQDPGTPGQDAFLSEFVTGVRPVAVASGGVCDPPDSTRATFSGSDSNDPDGGLRRAAWDWGDGQRDTLTLPDPRWPVMTHAYACLDARGCDGLDNDGDGAVDESGATGCDESYRVILAVEDSTGIWGADTTGVSFCAFLALAARPPDGAAGVDSALASVRVHVTRDFALAGLDPDLIRLVTEAGDSVGVLLSWDADSSEVVLAPVAPLHGATTFRVRLLPGLASADGRAFDQNPCLPGRQEFESRFTTRGPGPFAPSGTMPRRTR